MNRKNNPRRCGGVYIAVLGTSLIVALLGLSALLGQRIQNRMLVATTNIRQAQLNANSAVELALLTMKLDVNWRNSAANGDWFANRGTMTGTCTVNVTDPLDSDLADNADDRSLFEALASAATRSSAAKSSSTRSANPWTCCALAPTPEG